MYSKHFNLKENPFSIAPDPRYLYMSDKHREALAHLMYGLKTAGGFVLLTGEVGTGKTTVCRCLLEQLPDDLDVAFVLNPKLTASELLATICDELQISYDPGSCSIKELIDGINHHLLEAHGAGRKTVLIIDEAQNLEPEVLEQIRLLTNLETNQHKLLQIIMLGQPELRDQLAKPELRQLSQRITARYHLSPLDRQDIAPYINHRLAVAGHYKKLFPDKLVNRIFNLTNGIPRLINVVCDRSLLGTYVEGGELVSPPVLKKAALEVFGHTGGKASRVFKWLIPALFVISLAAALFFHNSPRQQEQNPDAPENSTGIRPDSLSTTSDTPEDTEALFWPDNIPQATSLPIAYNGIFSTWGKDYQPASNKLPCEQAIEVGLSCLARQGNMGSLRHLNRPAVLRIIDRRGREFYATMLKLGQDQATLLVASREIRISTNALEKQWFGSYSVLWQPPPGYSGPIKPDIDSPLATWLTSHLEKITGLQREHTSLSHMVTTYQKKEGLVADGIAGPETLIHLNLTIGLNGPTLVEN
jgi:general secretion pathway protein A